jgi:lipopolysaccharide export system ATP-binding protein
MHALEISGLKKSYNGKPVVSDITLNINSGEVVARKGIGYLPQEASIFRKLKVEDNIKAVLEITDIDRDAKKEKLKRILEEFNLTPIAKSYGYHLSGGERRKVEIARALAVDPVFILLDEPFAGIDPLAVNELKLTLRQLTEKGIGLVITDHNVRETLSITDRAYIISDGQILAHGKPDELIANELVKRSYLGEGFKL